MGTALPPGTEAGITCRSSPEDGDIVVREEHRDGRVVFVFHTAPGADQYLVQSREQAIREAETFAARAGVRAWLMDEGYEFILLKDFRRNNA